MPDTGAPPTGFYCPVCSSSVEWLWVWNDPTKYDRYRVFCAECASKPEYVALDEGGKRQCSPDEVGEIATQRWLRNIYAKEHRGH